MFEHFWSWFFFIVGVVILHDIVRMALEDLDHWINPSKRTVSNTPAQIVVQYFLRVLILIIFAGLGLMTR